MENSEVSLKPIEPKPGSKLGKKRNSLAGPARRVAAAAIFAATAFGADQGVKPINAAENNQTPPSGPARVVPPRESPTLTATLTTTPTRTPTETSTVTSTPTSTRTSTPTSSPTPDPNTAEGLKAIIANQAKKNKEEADKAGLRKTATALVETPTDTPVPPPKPNTPTPIPTLDPVAKEATREAREDEAFGKEKAKLQFEYDLKHPKSPTSTPLPLAISPGGPGSGPGGRAGGNNGEGRFPWEIPAGLAATGAATAVAVPRSRNLLRNLGARAVGAAGRGVGWVRARLHI